MVSFIYLMFQFQSHTQFGGIETFCPPPPRKYFDLGVLKHFELKNQRRKIVKIHKDFEQYQVFMYNFLCQNVLIFYLSTSLPPSLPRYLLVCLSISLSLSVSVCLSVYLSIYLSISLSASLSIYIYYIYIYIYI